MKFTLQMLQSCKDSKTSHSPYLLLPLKGQWDVCEAMHAIFIVKLCHKHVVLCHVMLQIMLCYKSCYAFDWLIINLM